MRGMVVGGGPLALPRTLELEGLHTPKPDD